LKSEPWSMYQNLFYIDIICLVSRVMAAALTNLSNDVKRISPATRLFECASNFGKTEVLPPRPSLLPVGTKKSRYSLTRQAMLMRHIHSPAPPSDLRPIEQHILNVPRIPGTLRRLATKLFYLHIHYLISTSNISIVPKQVAY
jgi:hypothetical protein